MSRAMMIGLSILLSAGLSNAQEDNGRCCKGGKGKAWAGYGKTFQWSKSLDAAISRAANTGQPVLYFELVGQLDRQGT